MSKSSLAAKNPLELKLARLELQPHGEIIVTDQGPVLVEGPVSAKELHGFEMDDGIKMFRQPKEQKKALEDIAKLVDGFVFIARFGKKIVGYVTFLPPEEYVCPGSRDVKGLIELGAIEVSSKWRRKGLGENLLREAFRSDMFEDYVIISSEYYWHWDLEQTKMSIWEYRCMLVDVLARNGFEVWNSNDPDILSHPANTFMVRVGSRITKDAVNQVKKVCSLQQSLM